MKKISHAHSLQELVVKYLSTYSICFFSVLLLLLFYSPIQTLSQTVVVHVGSSEDGDPKYDDDGVVNGVIVWGAGKVHVSTSPRAYNNEILKIMPGAIVKLASYVTADADGKLKTWYQGGSLTCPGGIQIDGATITDIRDDSKGGDTNLDGNTSQISDSDMDSYPRIVFPENGNNYLRNSSINYIMEILILNTMTIENNHFYKLKWLTSKIEVPNHNAAPNISGNVFEFWSNGSGLYLPGMSPIINGNTFRYASDVTFDSYYAESLLLIGSWTLNNDEGTIPLTGVTKVTNNIFEAINAITVNDSYYDVCESILEGYIYHAEIRNNTIVGKSVSPQLLTGDCAIELHSQSDIKIEGNVIENFTTYLKFWDCKDATESGVVINSNRFIMNPDGFSNGFNVIRGNGYETFPIINAKNNYWGDPSGPKDPSSFDGFWNPRGKGLWLETGNFLDYIPFTGGGVPAGKDKLHITAVTIDPLPDNNLLPDLNATIHVNVDNFDLVTANSGKIIAYVQDDAGFYYNLPGAEVTVTADQHSTSVTDITFKVPITASTMNVTAILFPEGDLPTTTSNTVNFKVEQLSNNLKIMTIKGFNYGEHLVNGNNHNLTAKIKYTLTTSSPVLNGSLEFKITRCIRDTNVILQEFPLITMPVESGSEKTAEKEIPLSFALLNYNEKIEWLTIEVTLKDENGIIKGSDKTNGVIEWASVISDIDMIPAKNSNGLVTRTGCNEFMAGEKLILIGEATIANKLENANNLQLILDKYIFVFKDFSKNDFYPKYQCVNNISPEVKNYNFSFNTDVIIPQNVSSIHFSFFVKDASGNIALARGNCAVFVKSPALTSSQPLPAGESSIQFTPVRAMMNVSSNTQAGELTAGEIKTSSGSSNALMKNIKIDKVDLSYWNFIPINTYWIVYESQPAGDVAGTISFQYDPAVDFPANPLFNENKLVIAGLNPYSEELEALTTTLDINTNTVTASYDKFFQTWVVASLDSVSTAVDQSFEDKIPTSYGLFQNYPNPFNPLTTINYSIPESGFVTMSIYDMLGNKVETLLEEEKPAGNYSLIFDADRFSSGIYFYQLRTVDYIETKKMILLK